MWYLFLCAWFTSLKCKTSSSTHVIANAKISSFVKPSHVLLCLGTTLSYLVASCLHSLSFVSSATTSPEVLVFLPQMDFIFLGFISRNVMAGS